MFTLSRRGFMRGSALLLISLLIQQAVSGNYSSIATAQSSTAKRPLRMLVLGDSVMWGQGHIEQNKFSYRLRDWLCSERNGGGCPNKQDVQIHVEAHSGAIISKPEKENEKKEEDRFIRTTSPVRYDGEVNYRYPTVRGQIELARQYYAKNSIPLNEVDLVIVNGGINDMGATRLLLPRLFGGNVKKAATRYCRDQMSGALIEIADTFPNARIIVPGYFPLISVDTRRDTLINAIKELFGRGGDEPEKKVAADELVDRLSKDEKRAGIIITKLAERSSKWVKATDGAYTEAVANLNRDRPKLPVIQPLGETMPADAAMRALYVPVILDHAYGSNLTFLWQLDQDASKVKLECPGKKISGLLLVDDDMQGKRPCMCDQAGKPDDIFCVRAGAFHPNRKGEDAYFNAITGKLGLILRFTGWLPGT
jgi:lysophospholipase L1-like esterase